MSAAPDDRRVRRRRRPARASAGCRSSGSPSGSAARRSSPTTGALLTERVALLRADAARRRSSSSYAVKANPMPAVVQHLRGLVDCLRRRVGARDADRARHADPRRRVSFAGPGKTPAELDAGGRRGRHDRDGVGDRGRRGSSRSATRLGIRPRVAVRVNPDFQVKGSGMRMGGGPQQFGVDAEQVPALLAELAPPTSTFLGFHVFAGSQNLSAEILCEAQRKTVELVLELADDAPTPVRYLNLGGGFGIPYFDQDQPLDLGRDRRQPRRPARRRASARAARGRVVDRARPLHRRRVRRLRHPRRRPQGVARPDVPRRRRRPAPPARRVRQLRPGDPAQLPGRDRQPRSSEPTRRSPSSAACARRSTCSATTSRFPRADVGDLVVIFQAGAYGLTASPTAFLGHPQPVEVLV